MSTVNTITFGDAVDLVERQMKVVSNGAFETPVEQIYQVSNKPEHTGDSIRFSEFDGEQYAARKNEGADAELATFTMGYEKTLYIKTISEHVRITKEMRKFNKHNEISQRIYDVTNYCPNRIDLDGANRFAYAASTTYANMDGETVDITGGDGLAIVSASHTLTQSSTTYSNIITGNPEFDAGGSALKLAISVGRLNSYDHFGLSTPTKFDTIITTDDEEVVENVSILLRSTSWVNPATASNTSGQNNGVINFYAGRMKHIIWPRLAMTASGGIHATKSKAWFLIDSMKFDGHLAYVERPNMVENDTTARGAAGAGYDMQSYDWEFGQTAMYGYVITSGRHLLASFPV